MNKISELAAKLTHKKGDEAKTGGKTEGKSDASGSNEATGRQDYLDRGLESAEQRVAGDRFDASKMKSTNDKVTGAVRDKFETSTGHKLPGTH